MLMPMLMLVVVLVVMLVMIVYACGTVLFSNDTGVKSYASVWLLTRSYPLPTCHW